MPRKRSHSSTTSNQRIAAANIDDLRTWVKYRKSLCDDCFGTCCTLPVEVRMSDLVRMELISEFEAEPGNEKNIAKVLIKQGIVERLNHKSGIFTLKRRANDDCQYLHPDSRLCTIYEKRPTTCREHPQVGPKPGFCAYQPQ